MNRIIGNEGRIDVLTNNAGFGLYGPIEEVSLDDARYQFEVNLFGVANLTQLVLPAHENTRLRSDHQHLVYGGVKSFFL